MTNPPRSIQEANELIAQYTQNPNSKQCDLVQLIKKWFLSWKIESSMFINILRIGKGISKKDSAFPYSNFMCTQNLPNAWNSIFSTYFSIIQYPEIKVATTHLKYLGKIWMQNWYQCYKKILPKPTTMQHQLWKSYILPVWIQVSEWLPT